MSNNTYPSLWCPFVAKSSPYAASAGAKSLAWTRHFNIFKEGPISAQRILDYGLLAGSIYANASPETLQITSDWISWLFLFDDECDESGLGKNPPQLTQIHGALIAVLRGADPSPAAESYLPFALALEELRDRMLLHAPPGWLARFSQDVEAYFRANQWEANNRSRALTPSMADYETMRLQTGAVYTCFALFGLSDAMHLPDEVHKHPGVLRLGQLANHVICWSNDILSVKKEQRQGDVHNLILVLRHDLLLDQDAAIERSIEVYDKTVLALLAHELPRFSPAIDSELARYRELLGDWIGGYLDWMRIACRYKAADPNERSVVTGELIAPPDRAA